MIKSSVCFLFLIFNFVHFVYSEPKCPPVSLSPCKCEINDYHGVGITCLEEVDLFEISKKISSLEENNYRFFFYGKREFGGFVRHLDCKYFNEPLDIFPNISFFDVSVLNKNFK